MNAARIATRLTAFCFAAFCTLVILAGVDTLATQQPSPSWMARVAATMPA